MKELDKKYNHLIVEKNKYDKWLDLKVFECDPSSKKPKYSIVIPPPNVTGKLHLGHAWDGTMQDFLIRFKKLNGFDTLWIPGMDHAGIATQAKVEERLKAQNISKHDLGREKFLEKVWDWKEEYAQNIRQQWSVLGLSLDYSKECFTYSPELNKIVNHVFVKMYQEGLIFKGKRVINWDPYFQTALSNIEVIYKEVEGEMFHFKYQLENSKEFIEVATTRPETMFGDVCVVVNPKDKRYTKLVGKKVINPANKQLIPIIADDYVEMNFGTGAMKCTPAHDVNDFEIGQRHNLENIICIKKDGSMNELALEFNGLDRFECRKQLIAKCTKEKTFIKAEKIKHQVGFSERSDVIVEPYLSDQWFVKMEKLSKSILNLQKSKDKINFYPQRFSETLTNWMENVHDWTISRQLWWGHRIPAWYHKTTGEVFVGEQEPKDIENWIQDEDVLDTWFSSALWPFATMKWIPGKKLTNQSELFQKYFPTNTLVTGYDIIFFWVSRMIFQSLEFTDKKPFNDVLIHGLIRDENGKKMSKSLGNGIDPMDVVEEFGCDSLRYFLLTSSTPGQDLRFSQEKIRASWNFINKIWNASRYTLMNLSDKFVPTKDINAILQKSTSNNDIDKWIVDKLNKVSLEIKNHIDKYDFNLAGKVLYDFVWSDFCNWYIELSKVNLNSEDKNIVEISTQTLFYVLKNILIMLHPFVPFVTEEIYGTLNLKESIMMEYWNENKDTYQAEYFENIINIVESIREFRVSHNIKKSEELKFSLDCDKSKSKNIFNKYMENINNYISKLINSKLIQNKLNEKDKFSISINDYFIEILSSDFIDEEEIKKQTSEKMELLKKEIERSEKILSNDNFISKASKEKIDAEKSKYEDYKKQYELLKVKIK